jgi:hypothetical protein
LLVVGEFPLGAIPLVIASQILALVEEAMILVAVDWVEEQIEAVEEVEASILDLQQQKALVGGHQGQS